MKAMVIVQRCVALGSLCLLSGCAFDDGRGFARLSAELSAMLLALDPASGRLQADGWIRTNASYELSLTDAVIRIGAMRVQGSAGGPPAQAGADCRVDPANPPPGCSLCHAGHCHCGDDLVDYEELEAQLCGAQLAAGPETIAEFVQEAAFDLLAQPPAELLTACIPSCELGQGEVTGVAIALSELHLRGQVRDASRFDRLGGKEPEVRLVLPLAGAQLAGALAPPAAMARSAPYALHLDVGLPLSERLFDDLDWGTLAQSGGVIEVGDGKNAPAAEQLLSNLSQSQVAVVVDRDVDIPGG